MRALLTLSVALALAGCHAAPTAPPEWPVAVVPAAGQPGRMVVVAPECAPMPTTAPDEPGTTWHNPHLGLGCSQARNLAVQVEQPRDMLAGRPLGPADAEREAQAVSRYRKGKEHDLMRDPTRSSFGGGGGGS